MRTSTSAARKSCSHSHKPPLKKPVVHFELLDRTARKVCLAGSFNNWKPETAEMIKLGNGKWAKDLALAPGAYEYRFVVDGNWMPDPNADHAIMNHFGEKNSLLPVTASKDD